MKEPETVLPVLPWVTHTNINTYSCRMTVHATDREREGAKAGGVVGDTNKA